MGNNGGAAANANIQNQFNELPENCSNARYLDIQAKKLMGSGSFGKSSDIVLNRVGDYCTKRNSMMIQLVVNMFF